MQTRKPLISETNGQVELTNEEIARYSRHLIMPEVALEGQKKLKQARVLTIGAGGLGAPLAMYLAAAGVGTLGIVDFDVVDESNLQRQIIHGTSDVGRPKLESAKETIEDINPNVKVETFGEALSSENALDIFRDFDIIVDGTDNFPTRYLVNDACVLLGKPNVYGSIFRFEGQASVFYAEEGPCYRCLYPEPPPPGLVPSCAEGGVLGILPGAIGVIQATETVKLILGIGEPLIGRLLLYDALSMRFREMKLRKDPSCPICGENRTIHELIDYEEFCGIPQAQQQEQQNEVPEITVRELKERLDRGENIKVLDVREPHEYQVANIGAPLIPLNELPERMHELNQNDEIAVHCKTGGRSARAVKLLRDAGFQNVYNVKGGITAWSEEIDPSVPKY
ncbi:putative adenylyltransferase/sulfurtransferase MoeZ [Rubrobacter xylanophilus DSM 9941]|uniref:molybdopterin-synthase adenylyltransferase MoeB n=1 Tax=Rubrobacter xylanophilus TaxID=49319 RepID=UPI001C6419A1|nr:molybdopterin-synthase adenylyltransferase MoeB [Rubrobacter xylanophilus]QYJ16941.1 putative adenylyltransferase/sulfurtransferase MoeZ [Rubrobacter xylanophilus DSM 9941]